MQLSAHSSITTAVNPEVSMLLGERTTTAATAVGMGQRSGALVCFCLKSDLTSSVEGTATAEVVGTGRRLGAACPCLNSDWTSLGEGMATAATVGILDGSGPLLYSLLGAFLFLWYERDRRLLSNIQNCDQSVFSTRQVSKFRCQKACTLTR